MCTLRYGLNMKNIHAVKCLQFALNAKGAIVFTPIHASLRTPVLWGQNRQMGINGCVLVSEVILWVRVLSQFKYTFFFWYSKGQTGQERQRDS